MQRVMVRTSSSWKELAKTNDDFDVSSADEEGVPDVERDSFFVTNNWSFSPAALAAMFFAKSFRLK